MNQMLPYRQLSRLAGEFYADTSYMLARLMPRRYPQAVLFVLVARVCLPEWFQDGKIIPPTAANRALTMNAIATSFSRPFETTRRYVQALIKEDFFVRVENGVTLSPSSDNAARVFSFFKEQNNLFIDFVTDIFHTCDIDWPDPGKDEPDAAAILIRALDILLYPFETSRPVSTHWVTMLVWTLISAENTRHITRDPELNRRYATIATPDEQRRPVPLRPIAKRMHLPYTTVWRLCKEMEAAGLASRIDDKWVLRASDLSRTEVDTMVSANMDYILRKVRELVALGLDLRG